MRRSDENSWTNSPAVLDEREALWVAVLSRLGSGYPLSPYAKMGRTDLEADGALWAQEMRDVPAMAIAELYDRTCRRKALGKDAGFPPNIGDFRAAWLDPEWDFWAQQNAPPSGLPALPAPLPDDGPGARTAAAQNEYRRQHGVFRCCECLNEYGLGVTAVLSSSGTSWVCALGKCEFEVEIDGVDADVEET